MSDELHICTSRTELYATNETPCLLVEEERLALMLDEMENAYRYELWQCLQKLTTIDGKVDTLATKTDINNLRTNLNTDFNVETVSRAEVHNMWTSNI